VPSLAVDAATDPDLVVGYRQIFAGQLTLLDEQLGRLLAALPGDRGRDGEAGGWGVLVAGVRGLPLGIHGWVGTGGPALPYGELVHVPAILVDPSGRMAGQRYGGLVVPADLGATLPGWMVGERSEASPFPAARPWAGRSLAGLFHDWSAAARDRVVVAAEGGGAIVTRTWHALAAAAPGPGGGIARPRLFAKPDDFFEVADVADRCSDAAERFGALMHPVAETDPESAWLSPLPADGPEHPDHRPAV
jgi:arylsulfatase A-like enzyme